LNFSLEKVIEGLKARHLKEKEALRSENKEL